MTPASTLAPCCTSGGMGSTSVVDGSDSPDIMADRARGRLRRKRPELVVLLEGVVTESTLAAGQPLRNLDFLAEEIEWLNAEIERVFIVRLTDLLLEVWLASRPGCRRPYNPRSVNPFLSTSAGSESKLVRDWLCPERRRATGSPRA
jgi:hypothetical protein